MINTHFHQITFTFWNITPSIFPVHFQQRQTRCAANLITSGVKGFDVWLYKKQSYFAFFSDATSTIHYPFYLLRIALPSSFLVAKNEQTIYLHFHWTWNIAETSSSARRVQIIWKVVSTCHYTIETYTIDFIHLRRTFQLPFSSTSYKMIKQVCLHSRQI